jgi:methionyl-tRNA formyltransferase
MRLVFMGNPQFAVPSLEKLLSSKHEVAAIVTSPDRPRGRGKKLCSPAVAEFARQNELNLIQQDDLKEPAFLEKISNLAVAIFVVVAFRILPVELFSIPPRGAINLHASLLPRFRGAAPIQWALIKGEKKTGLTTFLIEKKVDTGQVLLQQETDIMPEETADELSERLSVIGAELIVRTLDTIESGDYQPLAQDPALVSKAPKIKPEMGEIDWNKPAAEIVNLIHGLSSRPGAYTDFNGKRIKIFRARKITGEGSSNLPGEVIRADTNCGLIVKAGTDSVQIREIQMEGKRRLPCRDFVRGCPFEAGSRLG